MISSPNKIGLSFPPVAHRVSKSLMNQVQRGGNLKLSQNDLYLLIEKALIENDAYDVAKSLIFKRSLESTGEISVDAEPQEQIAGAPDPS